MYSSVIPDVDSHEQEGGTGHERANRSISLFDIGERLAAGKGV